MVDAEVHHTPQHRESPNVLAQWPRKTLEPGSWMAPKPIQTKKQPSATFHTGQGAVSLQQFYPLVVRKNKDWLRRALVRASSSGFRLKQPRLFGLSLTTEVACGRHEQLG
ncbi:hypothetical protein MLPM_0659 [Mycobacterium lepromatosis]|uniref:Uncharacterized protein n=1 Tax=Mycobacterium lepromatosis TaxID=480418 RepID=A0A0F4ESJ6_9MYCO|nr:hypothetical protein MLPM_0659 [Mycobacterium lepromatosis]